MTTNGPTAIDCQSFAGGFTLGMARAGFDVIEKRENVGGFGVPIVDYNRGLINPDLNIEVGTPETWRPRKADVVFGNPPCSGFSGYTALCNQTGYNTGVDHAINQCMWDFVAYAAACDAKIAIMESVQLAFTKGQDLMQALRFDMEERTGRQYNLFHVLHNNASVGGASIRKRYFMVLVRKGIRFGIEPPTPEVVPILNDLIYDLETLPLNPGPQRYRRKAKPGYPASLRSDSGYVDGHDRIHNRENDNVVWVAENTPRWEAGEYIGDATRRLLDKVGFDNFPDYIKTPDGSEVKASFLATHAYRQRRARGYKAAGVISGTGCEDTIHPNLPRPLTFREGARILGYPDDWSLYPMLENGNAKPSWVWNRQKWLGKGISVPCGEWIGHWARRALEGDSGPWQGVKTGGEREWVINVTNDHKAVYDERTGEQRDSRSKELVREMAARLG